MRRAPLISDADACGDHWSTAVSDPGVPGRGLIEVEARVRLLDREGFRLGLACLFEHRPDLIRPANRRRPGWQLQALEDPAGDIGVHDGREDTHPSTTADRAIDGRAWIDPEVVALAGISAEELDRYRAPAPFDSQGGAIPQPPIDPAKPHMRGYPDKLYEAIIGTPDEVIAARASETEPPVAV